MLCPSVHAAPRGKLLKPRFQKDEARGRTRATGFKSGGAASLDGRTMNDPLKNFKTLIVHSWPAGGFPGVRVLPVTSPAASAVYLVDLLCQGFRAGHLGDTLHVFHPSAVDTVPLQIWEGFSLLEMGPPPVVTVHEMGPSHGPTRSQSVPRADFAGSNVVPIDAAHLLRGTKRGLP